MTETKPSRVVNVDNLLIRRGAGHVGELARISGKLRENLYAEKDNLFSADTTQRLDEFVVARSPQIYVDFRNIINALNDAESTKSSGHDYAHLVDNVTSAVRIMGQDESFSESERLEVILACLTHDLGRIAEPVLENKDLDKKDLELLLPTFVWRELQRKITKLPEELVKRILFDITTSSEPRTGFLTSDIVHQCDREQLIGSAVIFRGLAFDVGIGGRDLAVPLIPELQYRLPIPDSEEDTYWLIQYEFYMRNLYPPVSTDGEDIAHINKRENAVILMLAMEGKGGQLFEQVFAPELGLVKPADIHWSKTALPDNVFAKAKSEEKMFLDNLPGLGIDFNPEMSGLITLTEQAIATDKVILPKDFKQTMRKKLQVLDSQEVRNYWTILIYTLIERHKKRLADLKMLESKTGTSPSFTAEAKTLVATELREREDIFRENFSVLAGSYI